MLRMGVGLLFLAVLVGCRAPGFDPLGLSGPTRVPPPPTGTIGDLSNGYYEPVPKPSLNQGAANWPATDFAPVRSLESAPTRTTAPISRLDTNQWKHGTRKWKRTALPKRRF